MLDSERQVFFFVVGRFFPWVQKAGLGGFHLLKNSFLLKQNPLLFLKGIDFSTGPLLSFLPGVLIDQMGWPVRGQDHRLRYGSKRLSAEPLRGDSARGQKKPSLLQIFHGFPWDPAKKNKL